MIFYKFYAVSEAFSFFKGLSAVSEACLLFLKQGYL